MNTLAARSRPPGTLSSPHWAMTNHIGTSTTSKNTKNSSRSSATKVPSMPTSSSSSRPISARIRAASGRIRSRYTMQSRVRNAVSSTSGAEMPSMPRWKRKPSSGTHSTSVSGLAAVAQTDTARVAALTTTPSRTASRSPAGRGSTSRANAPAAGTASSNGSNHSLIRGPRGIGSAASDFVGWSCQHHHAGDDQQHTREQAGQVRRDVAALGPRDRAGQPARATSGAEHGAEHDLVVGPPDRPGGQPHRRDDRLVVEVVDVEGVHEGRAAPAQRQRRVGSRIAPPDPPDRGSAGEGEHEREPRRDEAQVQLDLGHVLPGGDRHRRQPYREPVGGETDQ